MARRAAWPPVIHRHASGQARVRWAGKDYYLGAYGTPEAQARYERLLLDLDGDRDDPPPDPSPPSPPPSRSPAMTVIDAIARYVVEELPRHQDRRQHRAYRIVAQIAIRLFGALPIAQFRQPQLRAIRKSMTTGGWLTPAERSTYRRQGWRIGWCLSHTNQMIVRLRTIWRWLEGQGLAPDGSWSHLAGLPPLLPGGPETHGVRQSTRRRPATLEDVKAVARRCSAVVGRMLLVQFWSGMRTSEVCRLLGREIDQTGVIWVFRPAKHKTAHLGHVRAIMLGRKCQALLESIRHRSGWWFLHRRRQRFDANTYAQAVRRAADAVGLEWFSPYSCRHGARLRISRAMGLDSARAILGHASVEMTAQYAHGADEQTAIAAAKKCG